MSNKVNAQTQEVKKPTAEEVAAEPAEEKKPTAEDLVAKKAQAMQRLAAAKFSVKACALKGRAHGKDEAVRSNLLEQVESHCQEAAARAGVEEEVLCDLAAKGLAAASAAVAKSRFVF